MRLSVLILILLIPTMTKADEPTFQKKTLVFKTVGDVKIQADIYRPDDITIRPCVVWIHGGALILGSRTSVPKDILDLCRKEGFVLVSLDYRLAPQVKLPAIIEDIQDGFRWLHREGPKLLHIDTDRIVVSGGSAGGYLTLMTGIAVKPKPKALVAYWGYGDVDGDWYVKPSAHYRKLPLVSKEDALKAIGDKVLTDGSAGQLNRGKYYLYLRQNGLWTKEVTGFDPATEMKKLDPYCPVRNITAEYPPTMLVHGTEDTDVPYDLSVAMDRELTRQKVVHELVTVRGAGHGLSGGEKKLVSWAQARSVEFIQSHLKEKK
jgi:acetyl esterase/lipase